MGELDRPIVVDLPLRGEWTVERTPADRIPSHGTDLFGQRYAYDFIRTDDRAGAHVHPAGSLRWLLFGGRTRDCYGWGQPVHAALGGEVVDAVDGVRERQWLHVVRESWVAAHLAPGSVAVASGQHVAVARRSDESASGNSTAPHLHFQLMDSADPRRARGLPCAFADYLVQRDDGWEPVPRGIPHRRERVRRSA